MTRGEQFDMPEHQTSETRVLRSDNVAQVLAEMNLPALQQSQHVDACRLDHLHLDVGKALRVARQERRQYALDVLRRASHLEHAGVAALERLRHFADRRRLAQQTPAVLQQLLTLTGQHQPPANPIEKLEAELLLEGDNLPGQRGLRDMQAER